MTTPEGKVKQQVKKLLDQYPHYRHMPVQSGYGSRTLDFLCCVNGKFLAIETKRPGEELTMQQLSIKMTMKRAGAKVIVVDGDLTELEQWLKANDPRIRKA